MRRGVQPNEHVSFSHKLVSIFVICNNRLRMERCIEDDGESLCILRKGLKVELLCIATLADDLNSRDLAGYNPGDLDLVNFI